MLAGPEQQATITTDVVFLHHTFVLADKGDPYYPVPNKENQDLYAKYQKLAQEEEKKHSVHFVGT